jgi:putative ABC transport system ATP-binding protein
MLETKDLAYSYDKTNWITFPDMSCSAGDSYLILGQSGTGKTTFLHLLSGLLKPMKGDITIEGKSLSKLSGGQLDKFRGKSIGVVFQSAHFISSLKVMDNLRLAQKLSGNPVDDERIKSLLQTLNLGHKENALTKDLSVGEKQRVAIARAVINKPAILLADEPTSALDDKNCDEVLDLLEQTAKDASSILMIVTHDNRLKARFKNQIVIS